MKRFYFIFTSALLLVAVFFISNKTLAQEIPGECTIKSAAFNPYGAFTSGWFDDDAPKAVRITVHTLNCQGKTIEMSITEHDGNALDDDISELDNRQYKIGASNLLEINTLAGETECETTQDPDCIYYLSFYTSSGGLDESYDTEDQKTGTLKYECDTFCDEDWTIKAYGQGTSGNKWFFYGTSLSDKHGPFDTEALCTTAKTTFESTNGKAKSGCATEFVVEETPTPTPVVVSSIGQPIGYDGTYNLIEPLGDLKEVNKNTPLAGYLNILIKLIIGLGAVLAVVMIVIGGVQYMGSDAFGMKSEAKKRIQGAIVGLIIALASYMLLNTINPDLLRIDLRLDKVTLDVPQDQISFTSGGGAAGGTVGSTINQNITAYDALLKAGAQANGLECTWVKAFMYTESAGNPTAKSTFTDKDGKVGHAYGLMQLVPGTFQTVSGLTPTEANMYDPAKNIAAGTKYLGLLKQTACDGKASNSVCNVTDPMFIAAGYNGGPKANRASTTCPGQTWWQCVPNWRYEETRKYVQKIQSNYNKLVQKNWGC